MKPDKKWISQTQTVLISARPLSCPLHRGAKQCDFRRTLCPRLDRECLSVVYRGGVKFRELQSDGHHAVAASPLHRHATGQHSSVTWNVRSISSLSTLVKYITHFLELVLRAAHQF